MHLFSNLNWSLKTKLIVTSVLVEVILLAFLVWSDTDLTQAQLITEKKGEIKDLSVFIMGTVASSLNNNDLQDLSNLIKQVDKSSTINYIAIKSPDGTVIAKTGSCKEPVPTTEDLKTHIFRSGYRDSYRIMLPIEKQHTPMGQLDLEFNTGEIQELTTAVQKRGIINASLIVLGTVVLLYVFLGAMTKNLKHLTAAVTEYINTKTISTPMERSHDEVGKLSETFTQLISSIRHGEESLSIQEQTLKSILDHSPAVIYVKDLQGKYLLANKQFTDFVGVKVDEVIGKTDFDFFPQEVAERFQATDKEVLASHAVQQIEEIVPRNGVPQNYLSIKFCLFDKNGRAYAVCVISTDISERIRSEKLIHESEENLRSLANGAFDGIVVNKGGKHVFTNQRMADLLNTTMEEILGTGVEFVVHPSEAEKVRQRAQRRLQGFSEPMQYETLLRNVKTGEPVPAEITAFVSQWDSEPAGVIFVRDIRERKNTEAELNRYRQQLETLVSERTVELENVIQELESFSYSVSHDLRSPLRSIDGFSQLLSEDYANKLDDTGRDYINRVRKAAQHMAQLIDDILLLSRVSRHKLSLSNVNLSNLATESITMLKELQPEREVDVRIEPDVIAKGDHRLLKIMLDNLLGNAWKYTGVNRDTMIEFGHKKQDNLTVYYVKDNGVGFDMQYAEKLFGPFQRLHTMDEFPGTGIGLATVRRIIKHHSGKIWAEGILGEGATFYFTLGQ